MNELKSKALAQSIEALYREEYLRPFPHEERLKLEKLRPDLAEDLMDHFEFYSDFIAGPQLLRYTTPPTTKGGASRSTSNA